MILPFAEYLPDQPDFDNPGSSVILNVVPRTVQSYGPFLAPTKTFNALASRCQGAIGVRDSSANTYNFAGTGAKLYEATGAGSIWSDVSIGAGYNCSSAERWNFVQFGDNLLALEINDPIQSFVLNTSAAFANLSAAAPNARYGCVARDFLMVLNTSDAINGSRPQRVWWPAIGDPTNWPALGSTGAAAVQSDAQDIIGDFGWGTGLVSNVGLADTLIFFERAIFRAMYVGAPDIWGFYPWNGVRGCPVPGSIQRTEIGTIHLGPDDFYLSDASQQTGIGNQKIAKSFYADIDQGFLDRVSSALDPINKIYYLAYPSLSTGNGVVDTLLALNYGIPSTMRTPGRWAKIKDPSIMGEILFISTSFGYNVDNFTALTGYTVDSAPAGPDSRLWTGNKDILSFFDGSHTLNYFSGATLSPVLQTSEQQIKKNRRSAVTRGRPIMDGGSPKVTPLTRNRIEDAPVARTPSTINSGGDCFFKDAEGYYHRYQVSIPAGGSFTHMQGLDIPDDAVVDTGSR